MSRLTEAERKSLPLDDFAEPAARLYPIIDQEDVARAVKALPRVKDQDAFRERIVAAAVKRSLELPAGWKKPTDVAAQFSLLDDKSEDGDFVVRKTDCLFKPGDYAAQNFSMTPEELLEAAAEFTDPVPVDLEHVPTVLNGKLGHCVKVEASEDGSKLAAHFKIPKWLDPLLDKENPLSASFDRKTKRLVGVALVRKGQIEDAKLCAAFAAMPQATPGGTPNQTGPNNVVPALPPTQTPSNQTKPMPADHGPPLFQHILDGVEAAISSPAASVMAPGYRKALEKIMEICCANGAEQGKGVAAGARPKPEPDADDKPKQGQTADYAALEKQLADEKQKALAEFSKRVEVEAAAFAQGELLANRILPAELAEVTANFKKAAEDDAADGGSRVAAFRAMFAKRPAHQLTTEGARVLTETPANAAQAHGSVMTGDRRAALLSKSRFGQKVLEAEKN